MPGVNESRVNIQQYNINFSVTLVLWRMSESKNIAVIGRKSSCVCLYSHSVDAKRAF